MYNLMQFVNALFFHSELLNVHIHVYIMHIAFS